MLPNAAGLTWIDDHHVLFSEIEPGTGLHMGIVTASEDRQDERRVYFPAEARAMAHYSHLSPDRRWVLVVEMGRTGSFQPCRVVPFAGNSTGRTVGPNGGCLAAAWSPDGRWMYFTVGVNGTAHLWRQRFPDGAPQQITSGPATEESGIAIAPDGRSLITSVGQTQGSLWIHDARGDRLVTLDGSVYAPRMSRDGARVYCLVHRIGERSAFGLTQVDLTSGKADRMLTEFPILDFDISRDEQSAVFTTAADRRTRQIWLAALDRRSPPRRIATDADHARFARNGEVVYRSLTGTTNGLVRAAVEGGNAVRIFDRPVLEVGDVSPDGEWAIALIPRANSSTADEFVAVPVHGGSVRPLCSAGCTINISRVVKWNPDGSAVYVDAGDSTEAHRLYRFALRPGQTFPNLAGGGPEPPSVGPAVPWEDVAPGPDPSVYVFTRTEQRGNLFRVPLR